MKKNYLWGICAVMALSSCSQDEVVSVPQTGISYSVVTNKASRAQNVFCNNNLPDHFYVSAELQGTPAATYFTEDLVTRSGTAWSQEASRYWPEDGTLNFYAYANGNKGTNANNKLSGFSLENHTISNYTVSTDLDEQYDLIYAVKKGQEKPSADAAKKDVSLNFRHALSQIVFQAWNKNPNIYVEISGVEIHNVINKGTTFTFPDSDTDDNIVDHTQNGTKEITPQGTWVLAATTADYVVDFDNSIAVPYNGTTKVNLTNNQIFNSTNDTDDNEGSDFSKSLLLLPQGTDALTGNTEWGVQKLEETASGAFFFVKCKIWNVASGDGNVAKDDEGEITDVLVYSNDGDFKEIFMPVNILWKQGHKYVYTFIFDTDGDGGTDPEEGDPVLVPITYTVTVDDFTNEAETEVEMDSSNTDQETEQKS